MKRNAGVWLDNRKAIIVFVDTAGQSLQQIDSGVEGRVRLSGGSRTRKTPYGPQDVVHDSKRDARHQQNLRKYFREIIRNVATVDKLILFGPGEAEAGADERNRKIQRIGAEGGRYPNNRQNDRKANCRIRKGILQSHRPSYVMTSFPCR